MDINVCQNIQICECPSSEIVVIIFLPVLEKTLGLLHQSKWICCKFNAAECWPGFCDYFGIHISLKAARVFFSFVCISRVCRVEGLHVHNG